MDETQKITQPLWSKNIYKSDNDILMFYLPESDTVGGKRNEIKGMGFIPAGCYFEINQLIFFVDGKEMSNRFLDHMMKYSYIVLRVLDRDYLTIPCFCMERKERSLSFDIDIPIQVTEYISTCVFLYFSKKFKSNVDIMCLYMGKYGRRL